VPDYSVYLWLMQVNRRQFLENLAAVMVTRFLVAAQEATAMYGLIAKITVVPGKRDAMIEVLKESAANMPGCFSYVVAKDSADENIVWVTEVWDSLASHDASISLPAVKNAIPRAKEIVSNFERVAATTPVWGVGLPPSASR
jgi:quinol monooxygenase YgiN